MKFIDEKGRFLGKINVIDFTVVLLVLFALAFVGYKFSKGNALPAIAQGSPVVSFDVVCKEQNKDFIGSIKIGEKLISGTELSDATISDFSYKPSPFVATTSEGKVVVVDDPAKIDISIKISGKASRSNSTFKLGKQDLFIGNKFTVRTQTVQLDGRVSNFANPDLAK